MAVSSYLPDVAGGMVSAASFADESAAQNALEILAGSDVRPVTGTMLSRGPAGHGLSVGGIGGHPGRLVIVNIAGTTEIGLRSWHQQSGTGK